MDVHGLADLPQLDGRPLSVGDFRRIEIPFLNPSVRICQAMVWFQDRLLIGAGRPPLVGLIRSARHGAGHLAQPRSSAGARDEDGAQVVAFAPRDEAWELVYEGPVVKGDDGCMRARDRSVRAAAVCQSATDPFPCLYLGVGSLENNVVFLRSTDGVDYEECRGSGFGLKGDVPSVRKIVGWRGRLYSTPLGKHSARGGFDDNLSDFPCIFETDDALSGRWRRVSEMGFGRSDNLSINELAVFNDHLYAATLNARYGYELWKTDGAGEPPYRWTCVLDRGAFRGPTSSIPAAMCVFGDALYISGAVQRQARAGRDHYGPFPAELVRVYADDSWDLVCGSRRCTPHGFKRPISGLAGGFGDRFTHVFWRLEVHDGSLYLGTADWRWMPTFLANRDDLSEEQFDRLCQQTAAYTDGEFSLWRSADGERWEAVTTTGLPGSGAATFAIREMTSTPYGLFIAPAAKKGSVRQGGLDLWWGRHRAATG